MVSCSTIKLYVEESECNLVENITIENGFLNKKEISLNKYTLVSRGTDQTSDTEGLLIFGSGSYTTKNALYGQISKDDKKIMSTAYIQTIDTEQKEFIIQVKDELVRNFIQIGTDEPIEINEIFDYKTDVYLNNFLSTPNLSLKIIPLHNCIREDGRIIDYRNVIGVHFFVNNQEFAIMNFLEKKGQISFNEAILNSLSEEQKDYMYAFMINFYVLYKTMDEGRMSSGKSVGPRDSETTPFLEQFF